MLRFLAIGLIFVPSLASAATLLPTKRTNTYRDICKRLGDGESRRAIARELRQVVEDHKDWEEFADLLKKIDKAAEQKRRLGSVDSEKAKLSLILIDCNTRPLFIATSATKRADANEIQQVLDQRDAAIPHLIALLDNDEATRVTYESFGSPIVCSVGDIALELIARITRIELHLRSSQRPHRRAILERWWEETGDQSRIERLKWLFPETGPVGLLRNFRELIAAGESEFVLSILKKRFKSVVETPREADLLCRLGHRVGIAECKEIVGNRTRVTRARAVMHLVRWGDHNDFRFLTDVYKPSSWKDQQVMSYIRQTVFTIGEEGVPAGSELVLECLLKCNAKMDASVGDREIRICDVAMHLLQPQRFKLDAPLDGRDAQIREYLQFHKPIGR